ASLDPTAPAARVYVGENGVWHAIRLMHRHEDAFVFESGSQRFHVTMTASEQALYRGTINDKPWAAEACNGSIEIALMGNRYDIELDHAAQDAQGASTSEGATAAMPGVV